MDQAQDKPATLTAPTDADNKPARPPAPRNRRVRREPGGDHAIERIAAAARALAESEARPVATLTPPRSGTVGGPKPEKPALPAEVIGLARRVRMSGHLPYYAAALCFTLGFGGLVGSRLHADEATSIADADAARIDRALPWKHDVAEVLPRENVKLRDDVRALRGEIAALRTNGDQLRQAERDKQAGEVRALRAALETQKAETASLKADLAVRMERADRDVSQRGDKTAERIDRLEKRLADPTATGSIPASAKPAEASMAPKPIEKAAIPGIALRDAGRGVALLQTRRGLVEVVPGDFIPGAGKVEAIERVGSKWRVVTSAGYIEGRLD